MSIKTQRRKATEYIMRPNVISFTMTIAALALSGCAKSDWTTARNSSNTYVPTDDAAALNAKELPPPKILPETHLRAAELFESQGQFSKAVLQYQKAIATNHNYTTAYHQLGRLFGQLGRHDEAVTALARAADLDPDNATIVNNLGFAYAQMRNWEKAEVCFARARELRPDFDRAAVNHGMALAHLGRFDDALEAFQTCLGESEAYFNLGLMFRAQRRYEDAAYAFDQAVRLDSDFTAAKVQLDELCARLAWAAPLPASPENRTWLPSTRMIVAFSGQDEARRFFGAGGTMASTVTGGTAAPQPRIHTRNPTAKISLGRSASTRNYGRQISVIRQVAEGRTTFALKPSTKSAVALLETLGLEASDVMFAGSGRSPSGAHSQTGQFAHSSNPQIDPETGQPCEDQSGHPHDGRSSSMASTVITDQHTRPKTATIDLGSPGTTKSSQNLFWLQQHSNLHPVKDNSTLGNTARTKHTGQTPPQQ
jgi:tetratricopeptide (TPR) repeat protein